MWCIWKTAADLYRGGYSAFERTRAERLAQQQQAYEKQQAQRAHMESFIARFKAKATKARQAQSRIKALERLEELAPAHVDSPFNFSFRESDKISRPLLDLGEGRLGYGDKAVLEKVKLQLVPGARIGLLGPNGAGKSTLIKTLAGDLPDWAAACCAARTWPSDTSPSTSSIRWTHRPARCCICSVSPPASANRPSRTSLAASTSAAFGWTSRY